MSLPFITPEQRDQLLQNGITTLTTGDHDPLPVVKLFTPDAGATWLLSELDPDESDTAFGLCDLSVGSPELGYVSLSELSTLRGPLGLAVEQDRHFVATKPLSAYAAEARGSRRIIV